LALFTERRFINISMSVNVIISDDDHMIIKNDKKNGIKYTAIVTTVILIIFVIITIIKSDEFSLGFVIFWIAIFTFAFLCFLIDCFFQCKTYIEVSGENLLLRKYGKKTIEITSNNIRKICFSSYQAGESTSEIYVLRIKYGKHKCYNLTLYEPLEINKMEKFFIQYCNKRNIQVQ